MASATRSKPVPGACRGVSPALVVHGGVRALEFYAEVFQATERMRIPGLWGTIDHAEIEIGEESILIVEDESPYKGTKAPPPRGLDGSPSILHICVEDTDAVVDMAVKRGAALQRPPIDQPYGDHGAFIVDPFGHGWVIATYVEDATPDEMTRRMAGLQTEA